MEREIEGLKLELEKQKVSQVSSESTDAQVANVTEKFTKMKDFYNKLRSEHIELIRTVNFDWKAYWPSTDLNFFQLFTESRMR